MREKFIVILILFLANQKFNLYPSALSFDRYKFVVQVYVGERRDQGVRVGSRQFWDANTDNMASETFTNVRFLV